MTDTTKPVKPSLLNRMATKLPSFTAPKGPPPRTLESLRAERSTEVAKSSPAVAEPSTDTTPAALSPSQVVAPSTTPPATPKAAPPTHVLVPVETLQAIHDQLVSHADTVRALLPETVMDLAAKTAARLKAQGV
jgi:hypothetical protein